MRKKNGTLAAKAEEHRMSGVYFFCCWRFGDVIRFLELIQRHPDAELESLYALPGPTAGYRFVYRCSEELDMEVYT